MPKKPLLVAVLLLCIAASSSVAYSLIWLSSDEVHVDMKYAVALSTVSVVDSQITLNATVTHNDKPARSGINVDFYCSFDKGDWINFATQPTDDDGVAQAVYTASYAGGYDFKAIVIIP